MPKTTEAKAKKKQGRPAYKKDAKITHGYLEWPKNMPETAHGKRVKSSVRTSGDATKRVASVNNAIEKLLKHVDVSEAQVTVGYATAQQAVDPKFNNPAVSIWYRWKDNKRLRMASNKRLNLACDYYDTAIGNLRACLETLEGFAKLGKHPQVLSNFGFAVSEDLLIHDAEASENVKPAATAKKAPSISHLNPFFEWKKILQIADAQINPETKYPFSTDIPLQQRKRLTRLYHPDSATDPDEGKSFGVIEDSLEFVLKEMEALARTAAAEAEAAKAKAENEAAPPASEPLDDELEEVDDNFDEDEPENATEPDEFSQEMPDHEMEDQRADIEDVEDDDIRDEINEKHEEDLERQLA